MKIGNDNFPADLKKNPDDSVELLSPEDGNSNISADKVRKERELEDYPHPLAVVGVSVL